MKILPFPDQPMFLCYHSMAFPFGVIQANSPEDITKWACAKCVNFECYPKRYKNRFRISVEDIWGIEERLVVHQGLQIEKDYLNPNNMDLLNILKTAIKNNYYIKGGYNEKYIPNKWAFNNEDNMHDFLIIGCDDEKFISAGYVADGRFKKFEIPNENLIYSLLKTPADKIYLDLFSYEVGAVPLSDNKRMIDDLSKYISAAKYLEDPTVEINSYGILTNIKLKEFFVDEINKGRIYIDKRYSQMLYEHKWVLAQLTDLFLTDENKSKYQECANRNLERARLVHMLGLKLRFTGDVSIVYRATELIDQIFAEEMEYLPSLVELLHKNI